MKKNNDFWWMKDDQEFKENPSTYTTSEVFAKFYNSKEWKMLRDHKIRETPNCEHCWKLFNKVSTADCVDHIIPIEDDTTKALEYNNLQSLCDYHHRVKTAKDVHKRMKRKKKELALRMQKYLEK